MLRELIGLNRAQCENRVFAVGQTTNKFGWAQFANGLLGLSQRAIQKVGKTEREMMGKPTYKVSKK